MSTELITENSRTYLSTLIDRLVQTRVSLNSEVFEEIDFFRQKMLVFKLRTEAFDWITEP